MTEKTKREDVEQGGTLPGDRGISGTDLPDTTSNDAEERPPDVVVEN